jgi:hypothetical protein
MEKIWMAIHPGAQATRVLAMAANETIIKARLSPAPQHPRALQWLLEAVALWQGLPVEAVLCAGGGPGGPVTSLYRDWFPDFGNPLYTIHWVQGVGRPRRPMGDRLSAMGCYSDLKQLRRQMALEGLCSL